MTRMDCYTCWKVFSSKIHGDPATPVWKAYSGAPGQEAPSFSSISALSREIPIQGGCKCKEVGGKLPFHFGGNKTSLMIQSIKKQKKKEKHRGR